jgi:hypothetical protein
MEKISWADRVRNDEVLHEGGEEYRTHNKQGKAAWIGHIFHRNCLLRHVIEGKIKGYKRR